MGDFFLAKHFDNYGEELQHPFSALNFDDENVYALQFSSVKYLENGKMYSHHIKPKPFSLWDFFKKLFGFYIEPEVKQNIIFAEQGDGLKYRSTTDVNKIFILPQEDIINFLSECSSKKWYEITNILKQRKSKNKYINDFIDKL
ncbi:hypothetical protein [Spiroplasma endosymbiont of Crioceris asparagi]|uniref:hypothetical protein n=1 Tax=Spiroplasma endosymbiont of Crioceris asparagi TaxID=3066286 RepID=UPI0030CD41B1